MDTKNLLGKLAVVAFAICAQACTAAYLVDASTGKQLEPTDPEGAIVVSFYPVNPSVNPSFNVTANTAATWGSSTVTGFSIDPGAPLSITNVLNKGLPSGAQYVVEVFDNDRNGNPSRIWEAPAAYTVAYQNCSAYKDANTGAASPPCQLLYFVAEPTQAANNPSTTGITTTIQLQRKL
jgi:hypothetical protein